MAKEEVTYARNDLPSCVITAARARAKPHLLAAAAAIIMTRSRERQRRGENSSFERQMGDAVPTRKGGIARLRTRECAEDAARKRIHDMCAPAPLSMFCAACIRSRLRLSGRPRTVSPVVRPTIEPPRLCHFLLIVFSTKCRLAYQEIGPVRTPYSWEWHECVEPPNPRRKWSWAL